MTPRFTPRIGLEVHVQLKTERKLFCADPHAFGAPPNSQVCPVCLGLPGALPVLNAEAVRLALRAAVALDCDVRERSFFVRKNYHYPDLPKGYQISQLEDPLATGGRFALGGSSGGRTIRIQRLHLEEDAGRSLHDRFEGRTAIDLNRAGVPLLEVVTGPDLRGAGEAGALFEELRRLFEFIGVSDCRMEEGGLRADANVSMRRSGAAAPGAKTEIKNVNSFSGLRRAVAAEIERQTRILASGGRVEGETRRWDRSRGEVPSMRRKEGTGDYRYLPDPDLPPLVASPREVAEARRALPELPAARRERLRRQYALTPDEAWRLTSSPAVADCFEELAEHAPGPKIASNWVVGPVMEEANRRGGSVADLPLSPAALGRIASWVEGGVLSWSAGKKVLRTMLESGRSPEEIVEREALLQVRDSASIEGWVDQVLAERPDEARRVREGEGRLVEWLIGQVMRKSGGRAEARRVREALRRRLRVSPSEGGVDEGA